MINNRYSKCWLPDIEDKIWKYQVFKSKIFKNIFIPNEYNFIKEEIIYFIDKKNINFTNNFKIATLLFKINKNLSNEEYYIKKVYKKIFIFSLNKNGFLYGLFYIFKIIQLNKFNKNKNFFLKKKPSLKIRMIDHWDNLNGEIEKSYSGNSIFFFQNNVHYDINRIRYYSRLLCSIGINYICINNSNVNLLSTYLITKNLLIQLNEIYNILYKYNIKIFISVNYRSPIIIGKINTFDPLNKKVILWWNKKIEQIYEYLPNLAGLVISPIYNNKNNLFKNRNHIQSSNPIAKSLKYFNGILFWKCNNCNNYDWKCKEQDRACTLYNEYNNLDGFFLDNVYLQIKFGPIGYQIREPVSPLLGSMKRTSQILEFQMNQQYMGQQIDFCWLPPKWKNILNFNTYYINNNSKIKKLISGKLYKNNNYGITCVSNIGNNYYWTNHFLSQSNLFSYGRILWNLNINLNNLLKEWITLSVSNNDKVIKNIRKIIFNSLNVYENYTVPLGLGGMVDPNKNYEVNIDGYEYTQFGIYHNANRSNIGNNRTSQGTKFTDQYNLINKLKFNDINRCPRKLLLFFHKLSYKDKIKKKISLIQYMYDSHFNGIKETKKWIFLWKQINNLINKNIYKNVIYKLFLQYRNSCKWCDIFNTYFYRKSGIKDNLNRKIYK